jgi:hypothetical protein
MPESSGAKTAAIKIPRVKKITAHAYGEDERVMYLIGSCSNLQPIPAHMLLMLLYTMQAGDWLPLAARYAVLCPAGLDVDPCSEEDDNTNSNSSSHFETGVYQLPTSAAT